MWATAPWRFGSCGGRITSSMPRTSLIAMALLFRHFQLRSVPCPPFRIMALADLGSLDLNDLDEREDRARPRVWRVEALALWDDLIKGEQKPLNCLELYVGIAVSAGHCVGNHLHLCSSAFRRKAG